MKRIVLTISVVLMVIMSSSGQSDIDNYKYAILPQKFDFFKKADHFKLNTLTRYLFKKNGFEVYYSNETLPDDLEYNTCNAVRVDVIKLKSLLKTRLKIQLKNCHNVVLFESFEGVSKNKDLEKAYKEALMMAFNSIEDLNYSYQPESKTASSDKNIKETSNVAFEDKNKPEKTTESNKLLKAISNDNGYVLQDAKGNKVFQLIKSQKDDVFFLSNNQGILYKMGGNKWVREFMVDGKAVTEILYIEF